MRVPGRSLVLFFVASTAHAVRPACDLLLEIRFDRPAARAASVPHATDLHLKIDVSEFDSPLASAAREALGDLDKNLVARVLAKASLAEQESAFRSIFDFADMARLARDARYTLPLLFGRVFARADALGLSAGAHAALADLPRTEVSRRARAAFVAEGGLELTAELMDAARGARLRLTGTGADAVISHDSATGAPDRATYELARRLEVNAAMVEFMPTDARDLARTLIRAKRRALARAWADSHYQTLTRIRYTEPVPNGFVDRPVRDFIEAERFRHPFWWETFAKFAEFEDFADGRAPGPPAKITAQTSRSPLAYLFGRAAERLIYWPAIRDRAGIRPDLSRLRLNETLVDGKSEAIELLVNEHEGGEPRGYLFMNFGGDLVPTMKFNGQPVARACLRCHATDRGSLAPAFQPFFLRTAEDLRKVGYRGERIIRELLAH